MDKGYTLIFIIILFIQMISGCIDNTVEDQNDETFDENTFEIKSYVQENLSINLSVDNRSYYLDENDQSIMLNLKNNGNKNVSINPFNANNIYITCKTRKDYFYHGYVCTFSSYYDSKIQNNTRLTNQNATKFYPGDSWSFQIDLRSILVYIYDSHLEGEWISIQEFIDIYLPSRYSDSYLNLSFTYLPLENESICLKSNTVNLSLRWHPVFDFNLCRIWNDDIERKAINFAENLNYSSLMNVDRFDERFNFPYHNYIDNKLIQYHISEYEYFRNNSFKYYSYSLFNYSSNVTRYNSIYIDNKTSNISFYYTNNSNFTFNYSHQNFWGMLCYYNLDLIKNHSVEIKEGYIVHMDYEYIFSVGPLAGRGETIRQHVFLSNKFDIILIISNPSGWVS